MSHGLCHGVPQSDPCLTLVSDCVNPGDPIGIPLLYLFLLLRAREAITDRKPTGS